MSSRDKGPELDELLETPELAVLAVLDRTLEVAQIALASAHPELTGLWHSTGARPAAALTAEPLVEQALALRSAIGRYRLAVILDSRKR